MARTGDIYVDISVNSPCCNVFHQQCVNVFDCVFIKRFALCDAPFHIIESFLVVYDLVYFAQLFPADGYLIFEQEFCFHQGKRVALNRGGIVRIFDLKGAHVIFIHSARQGMDIFFDKRFFLL